MDENCYVEPLHKKVTSAEYQKTRLVLLAVQGMGCPNCAARVRNSLIALHGVTNVRVDHLTGNAQVTFNPDLVAFPALLVPDQPEFEEFARPRANEQHEGVLLSSPHKFSLLRY